MTYTIDPTQLMLLDEGVTVRLVVRADVGAGHRLWVQCGRERRRVRVVEVERGYRTRACVEVDGG